MYIVAPSLDAVERAIFVELPAGGALVAGVSLGCRVLAVDALGKNAGRGGLAHPSRTAEEVGVGQAVGSHGIAQRGA